VGVGVRDGVIVGIGVSVSQGVAVGSGVSVGPTVSVGKDAGANIIVGSAQNSSLPNFCLFFHCINAIIFINMINIIPPIKNLFLIITAFQSMR